MRKLSSAYHEFIMADNLNSSFKLVKYTPIMKWEKFEAETKTELN